MVPSGYDAATRKFVVPGSTSLFKTAHLPRGLAHFAFVSEPGQSGIAQASRIALASVGRCNNSGRDGVVDDLRLSRAVECLARGIKGFAHELRVA